MLSNTLTGMYYLLIYQLADDYIHSRAQYRSAHLQHVKDSMSRAEFVMGGAFEGNDKAGLLFKVDNLEIVETFAQTDPYILNQVAKSWYIRPWNIAIGG